MVSERDAQTFRPRYVIASRPEVAATELTDGEPVIRLAPFWSLGNALQYARRRLASDGSEDLAETSGLEDYLTRDRQLTWIRNPRCLNLLSSLVQRDVERARTLFGETGKGEYELLPWLPTAGRGRRVSLTTKYSRVRALLIRSADRCVLDVSVRESASMAVRR
jgi:hypothetical protein